MTKREIIRWIKFEVAAELRQRISEPPDRIQDAPDPAAIEKHWAAAVSDIADKIFPEGPRP